MSSAGIEEWLEPRYARKGERPNIRRGIYATGLDKRFWDFRAFMWLIWRRLGLPEPTEMQYAAADFIQSGVNKGISPWESPNSRLFMAGFRGMGKSWVTSAFVVWCLALDPSLNILIVSGNQERATEATVFCKRLIQEIPELAFLEPHDKTRWANSSFDVQGAPASHAPSMKARSITGAIVGSRADIIVPDDIETPQNSETQHQREKLELWSTEFSNILKPAGRIVMLGTYQTADSIYYKLAKKGYACRTIPARYPAIDEIPKYESTLEPLLLQRLTADPSLGCGYGLDGQQGKPTDPVRFDDHELMIKELDMGHSQARLQLMLDPELADSDRYPLKLADLIIMDTDDKTAPERPVWASGRENVAEGVPNPGFMGDRLYRPMRLVGEWRPYKGTLMTIDPAGGGADEFAVLITATLNGFVYLLYGMAFTDRPDESKLIQVARLAKEYRVSHIRWEDNMGDGMFGQIFLPILRRHYQTKHGKGCSTDAIKHYTNKEQRIIAALEPAMNAHRLVVSTRFANWDHTHKPSADYSLLHQLSRLQPIKGALRRDDRLDCLAIAMQYWNEQGAIGLDVVDEMERVTEEEEYRDLMEFLGEDPDDFNFLPDVYR